MSPLRIEPLATTGIGSLPHTQMELALQQSFSLDIPYLPQLPRRDPAELMIAQALDGLPGLRWDAEGTPTVRLEDWRRGAAAFDRRLSRALDKGDLAPFEPQPGSARAWKPFLWEVGERGVEIAKAQLCGPITCAWTVRLDDGRPVFAESDLVGQIFRAVMARSLAMARAIGEAGAAPIIFLDEPGLVWLEPRNPQHLLRLSELKLTALALTKAGARPGVHCCGNTRWGALLPLGLSYLSIDARLSLELLLEERAGFERFLAEGGRLALGVVPTDLGASPREAEGVAKEALTILRRLTPAEKVLGQCLVTPACGLALRSIPDSEAAFAALERGRAVLRQGL
ncbi:MAG: uroporphyrinogen decarboxylase/cobalamine-independent methonine synthase family protein [Myxococcales bacterium]